MKHFFSWMRGGLLATLVLLLWLVGPAARAQAPAWTQLSTGLPISSGAFSYTTASATDATGNVYLAGYFFGSVSFGPTVLTSNATVSPLAADGFVAKWNSATGAFVWAVALSSTAADQVAAIAVSNGAVYVSGYFSGPTLTLGPFSLTNANPNFSSDVFVAKLADAGPTASFVWARPAGGPGTDTATGIAVSGSSVYLTGFYNGATFTADGTVLTNGAAGTSDAFVAKLADAGPTASFGWSLNFGGSGLDEARGLALSGGSMYVVGDFTSPALTLGAISLLNTAGSTSTTADIFVAKLADAGSTASVVWAQRVGSNGADTGDAIALNGSSLYVAGSFGGISATVGSSTFINASSTATTSDVLVVKLADNGAGATVRWAQAGGGVGSERPRGVAVRDANVYVAGGYGYPNATFGLTTLVNRGTGTAADIFVTKLTDSGPNGTFTWAQSAGGVNGESAFSIALTGNLVVAAGGAAPLAAFSTLMVPAGSTTASAFVATILDATLTATSSPALADAAFTLYPNPARAATTVQLPALPGTPTATLTLRDALGRALRTATVALPAAGLRHELDLTNLPAGIYALQVQAGAATATRRLVVE